VEGVKITVKISARSGVHGSVALPGDKSISHRYAMLAAITAGESKIANFSTGADCQSTLACMQALGARVARDAGVISIRGGDLQPPRAALDCGNSGSTMRMLSGIVAGQAFDSELIGDESLSRRPMRRVIEPLERMGARIDSGDGRAPLRFHGTRLNAIDYKLPVASAQVKSAVLLAGLFANGHTWVEEPVRTRDHTEIALAAFGARVERDRLRAGIAGGQALHGIEAVVPGDLSSAAFFLCATAIFPGSELIVENVLLNPRRAVLLDTLTAMGAQISVLHVEERLGELAGAVRITGGKLRGGTIEGAQTAALIDELPVLAAIAPYTSEGVEFRDASELRHKESDRIAAVSQNLRAMGAEVEEREDGLRVRGGQELHGAEIDSHDDHRIAMAFAVAALRARGDSVIRGADCARISFPEFFELLDLVTRD
jgi:3-phosphoshikimate 1-carboxyvinyltransferase